MCGIIGYIGNKDTTPIIIDGLGKLEYRGYDSAGIATIKKRKISILKCKGRIADLESLLAKRYVTGNIGLGHTRWATHGAPSVRNAHPHTDGSGKIVVVHNGIIENYDRLRKELIKNGHRFKSDTDTEVIAHLISKFYKGNLVDAVRKALSLIKGSFAIGVMCSLEPEKLVAAKYGSFMLVGLGKNENFLASDAPAILKHTRKVIYLEDNQMALITRQNVEIFNLAGKRIKPKVETISYDIAAVGKGGFKHFMLKEISEQPDILSKMISLYVAHKNEICFKDLKLNRKYLKGIENIIIIACGTAYHAGIVGKYIIEHFTRIPVLVDYSSEFRYRKPIIKKNSLAIAISQSGETADTLAALSQIKKSKVKTLAICNVLGSSLTRECDSTIYTHAGPEISVASTKAYTAQLMVLYLFALYLASIKRAFNKSYIKRALDKIKDIPGKQKEIIDNHKEILKIAKKHLHFGSFLYLGRNINYPTALEGALKLKEISYIPAEGYAAGEMKHGPIALIDEYRAVICIAVDSFIYDKMVSNIQEILARQGKIIILATKSNKFIKDYATEIIYIPKIDAIYSPLLTILPLQLFAYYVAQLKGFDVDKPRNLAKSVTVE